MDRLTPECSVLNNYFRYKEVKGKKAAGSDSIINEDITSDIFNIV